MFSFHELGRYLPRMPTRVAHGGGSATLLTDAPAWERVKGLIQAVDEVVTSDPAVFEVEEARRALRGQLLGMTIELIQGAEDSRRGLLLRECHASQKLMRAIDDHLRASPRRAVTGTDLARDLAVPEERLKTAVRAAFGIGLGRYLLTRRLLALHAEVSQLGGDQVARRTLATAYGFWDLGLLEREHYSLFRQQFLAVSNRN
jgi:hypothetical protein